MCTQNCWNGLPVKFCNLCYLPPFERQIHNLTHCAPLSRGYCQNQFSSQIVDSVTFTTVQTPISLFRSFYITVYPKLLKSTFQPDPTFYITVYPKLLKSYFEQNPPFCAIYHPTNAKFTVLLILHPVCPKLLKSHFQPNPRFYSIYHPSNATKYTIEHILHNSSRNIGKLSFAVKLSIPCPLPQFKHQYRSFAHSTSLVYPKLVTWDF